MDKNQAIIDFLLTCPAIIADPLFFNFLNAKDNNQQIITQSNDKSLQQTFIDGSVLKRYTFTLIFFKSVLYQAIPKVEGLVNENVEELGQVQAIIDWVTEQNDSQTYPDFGEDCEIDEIKALSENPGLNGVDTTVTPALAKYSVTIQVDYLDKSKAIWK